MSTIEIREWLVTHKREIVLFILFFLVSSISFALGYLSAQESDRAPIVIEKNGTASMASISSPLASASIIDQVHAIENDDNAKISVTKGASKTKVKIVSPAPPPVDAPATDSPPANPSLSSSTSSAAASGSPLCHYQTSQFPSYTPIIFNEIGWMGTASDSANEWIELKNISAAPIQLEGYEIVDKAEQIKVTLPPHSLPAGGYFLLVRGGRGMIGTNSGFPYTGALNNTNEGLRLFDSECLLVDSVEASPNWPAGDASQKRSMERGGGYSWQTYNGNEVAGVSGTPGAANSAGALVAANEAAPAPTSQPATASSSEPEPDPEPAPAPPEDLLVLQITEVMAGSEANNDDEFIELFNPNSVNIDLTGYTIKKKSSTGTESSLVVASRFNGKNIPAGKYFLIVREGAYQGTVSSDLTWPPSSAYDLAYSNNAVILYDASGVKVSEVSWVKLEKGQSTAGTPTPQNSSQ